MEWQDFAIVLAGWIPLSAASCATDNNRRSAASNDPGRGKVAGLGDRRGAAEEFCADRFRRW